MLLFVTYIGGRYNKIKWIAFGAVLMSIGSFLFTVPHFGAPVYDYTEGNCPLQIFAKFPFAQKMTAHLITFAKKILHLMSSYT